MIKEVEKEVIKEVPVEVIKEVEKIVYQDNQKRLEEHSSPVSFKSSEGNEHINMGPLNVQDLTP